MQDAQNPVANTAPSPTSAPVNHTSLLNEKIASLALVESLNPLRRVSDDPSGLETYQGTLFVAETGGCEYASTWTLRMTDSNGTARLRYQQLLSQKRDESYKQTALCRLHPHYFETPHRHVVGVNNHKAAQVMHGYNHELLNGGCLV